MDVVIAARSFHWFTNRAALEEIHRVLTPDGSFGITWSMEDLSFAWLQDFSVFLKESYKELSLLLPHVYHDEWMNVFSLLSKNLFGALEEYVGFPYSEKSSLDHAFNLFSSYSNIAGASERIKKKFPKVFDEITKKHFKDKGIPFKAVQFKMYMYWCTKEV